MWLKLVRISLFFLLIFVCYTCQKENGKNEYELAFYFDNGGVDKHNCILFEKRKKYEDGYGMVENLTKNEHEIVLQSYKDTYFHLHFIKTEAGYLASISTTFHSLTNNLKYINGSLEMNGKYYRKGKVISVNEGTFSVFWENASDYGEQPQLLTGKWTLKKND
ncbi:MAG: hypothetical protein R2779_00370 [Crocinitomicaceae bacterium]